MFNYLSSTIKSQLPSGILQSGTLSLLDWLRSFEKKPALDFDSITNIASEICSTPIVLVGLIHQDGIQYKSAFQPTADELAKTDAICRKVIQNSAETEPVELEDSTGEPVFCIGLPIKNSDGNLIGVLCVINDAPLDLSDRAKVNLKNLAQLATSLLELRVLTDSEDKQIKIMENDPSVNIYLISPVTLKILFANSNSLKSLNSSGNYFQDKDITEILTTIKPLEFKLRLLDLAISEKRSFSTFAQQINPDGSRTLVKLFVSFIPEGFESSILIISKNLSNSGLNLDVVEHLFNYDSITGFGNRKLLENSLSEKIHSSLDTSKESGLLLIDLENLKFVSKSFGSIAGDNVRRQLADLLEYFLDPAEILIRTAQDAFCVILPDSNRAQLKQKAVAIIDLISGQDFSENGKKFKLHVNIGAVSISDEDSKNTDYLSLAYKACDIAKEFGQNQFYLANMQDAVFIRKIIEMEQLVNVQDAIERNRLALYEQKIARVREDANDYEEHLEILIRMLDKNNAPVPPSAFIPQLEKHGSIISLDKWVLKESLKLIDERHQNIENIGLKKKFMYNINLSARTIADACFISYCTEMLIKYSHLAPSICFEITETVAISNFQSTREFINIIRRFGCKFALDDFGSGGASLECLKELSIDFVKIDGSFVSDVVENPISQIIIESICKVADVLKIKVIAEKVETQTVEDALIGFGVHYTQGYKTQKPSPLGKNVASQKLNALWLEPI